jgi:hypothetical protein
MSGILLPYRFVSSTSNTFPPGYYVRELLPIPNNVGFLVWEDRNFGWSRLSFGISQTPCYATKEEAMAALDIILIEKGYTLVKEEDVERVMRTMELLG